MAISFSRPDPSSPTSVASAAFTTSRKGFEQAEVREFLRMVAAELARLQERERFLERELRQAQRSANPASVALDEELVTKMLGEEAARILQAARDASGQIRSRAEESAARLLKEANDEAQRQREEIELEVSRRRHDATADAESEIEMAKQQGREMVNEARAYRERVLGELSRRREMARQQIEQLVHGRDRLLNAFERARIAAVDVMADLTPLGEPSEYVNLSPTTGPVPLMVPNMPRPGTTPPAPVSDPDATVALAAPSAPSTPALDPDVTAALEVPVAPETAVDLPAAGSGHDVDLHIVEIESERDAHGTTVTVTDTVVHLDIARSDDADDEDPHPADRAPANVVSLFGGRPAAETPAELDDEPSDGLVDELVIDDLVGDEPAIDEQLDELDDVIDELDVIDEPAAEVDPVGDRHPSLETEVDDATVADIDSLDSIESSTFEHASSAAPRRSADDLFARLRAARAESVAERATAAPHHAAPHHAAPPHVEPEPPVASAPPQTARPIPVEPVPDPTSADSVFRASAPVPVTVSTTGDTPFARRDEVLTPLIVAAARKLKRVLADEQNDVLHALRGKDPVRSVEQMVSTEAEQAARYAAAVLPELTAAAVAGAVSMGAGVADAQKLVERAAAADAARELLAAEVIQPLRTRLERCVADADGDNTETASLVRLAYREWKTQRIDEQLDDIARTAFGHGALAGTTPGTPICWMVDPQGPDCADAEDNSLGGVVPAGSPFPTDHRCAPAHSGCRCMIVRAD